MGIIIFLLSLLLVYLVVILTPMMLEHLSNSIDIFYEIVDTIKMRRGEDEDG